MFCSITNNILNNCSLAANEEINFFWYLTYYHVILLKKLRIDKRFQRLKNSTKKMSFQIFFLSNFYYKHKFYSAASSPWSHIFSKGDKKNGKSSTTREMVCVRIKNEQKQKSVYEWSKICKILLVARIFCATLETNCWRSISASPLRSPPTLLHSPPPRRWPAAKSAQIRESSNDDSHSQKGAAKICLLEDKWIYFCDSPWVAMWRLPDPTTSILIW